MIYSNERKLCLSGWLKEHSEKEYNTSLKLQKFLVLYEAFTKVKGEEADFSHLRGYKKGPVFSNVWGDYTKERQQFNLAAESAYRKNQNLVNEPRARKSAFIVGTLSEVELSDLTHNFNFWNSKKERIGGEKQVNLSESDFNQGDYALIETLDQMYDDAIVENSEIVNLDKLYFVFPKEDIKKLTESHFDTLLTLAEREELHNPVYVEIDQEGRLVVD